MCNKIDYWKMMDRKNIVRRPSSPKSKFAARTFDVLERYLEGSTLNRKSITSRTLSFQSSFGRSLIGTQRCYAQRVVSTRHFFGCFIAFQGFVTGLFSLLRIASEPKLFPKLPHQYGNMPCLLPRFLTKYIRCIHNGKAYIWSTVCEVD